jgi:hypothetical protein
MTNKLINTYREGKRGGENMTVKTQRHCSPLPSLFSFHGGAGKWNILGLTINTVCMDTVQSRHLEEVW